MSDATEAARLVDQVMKPSDRISTARLLLGQVSRLLNAELTAVGVDNFAESALWQVDKAAGLLGRRLGLVEERERRVA